MRRRLLAIFLTLTMALAVFPASALATGDDPDTGEPSEDTPTCICTELCTEEGNPDCPVCLADYSACEGTAPEETGDEPTEEPGEPQQPENTLTEESTQVELLQARIDALPTVEELSAMGPRNEMRPTRRQSPLMMPSWNYPMKIRRFLIPQNCLRYLIGSSSRRSCWMSPRRTT